MCGTFGHTVTVPKQESELKRVVVLLDEDMAEELQRLAVAADRSLSAQVRRMLRQALAKEKAA